MLKGSNIVTNEIANFGLDVSLKKIGLNLKRVKVGDKNILQEIRNNGYYFGGEPSGHFIFKDDTLIGDGMSTALRVLTIMLRGFSSAKASFLSESWEVDLVMRSAATERKQLESEVI